MPLADSTVLDRHYTIVRQLDVAPPFTLMYAAQEIDTGARVHIQEYFPDTLAERDEATGVVRPMSDAKKAALFQAGMGYFRKEAGVLGAISHARLASEQAPFTANGTLYRVRPAHSGPTLAEAISRKGSLSLRAALTVVVPVLGGLRVAHERGLIHGGITPASIRLRKKKGALLTHFSSAALQLARRCASCPAITQDGLSAPEMYAADDALGPWTDVYSAAATLVWTVTGTRPPSALERDQADALSDQVQSAEAISEPLADVLLEALALDPEARFRSVDAFRLALQDALAPAPDPQPEGSPSTGADELTTAAQNAGSEASESDEATEASLANPDRDLGEEEPSDDPQKDDLHLNREDAAGAAGADEAEGDARLEQPLDAAQVIAVMEDRQAHVPHAEAPDVVDAEMQNVTAPDAPALDSGGSDSDVSAARDKEPPASGLPTEEASADVEPETTGDDPADEGEAPSVAGDGADTGATPFDALQDSDEPQEESEAPASASPRFDRPPRSSTEEPQDGEAEGDSDADSDGESGDESESGGPVQRQRSYRRVAVIAAVVAVVAVVGAVWLGPFGDGGTDPYAAYRAEADSLFARADYAAAKSLYRQVLDAHPDDEYVAGRMQRIEAVQASQQEQQQFARYLTAGDSLATRADSLLQAQSIDAAAEAYRTAQQSYAAALEVRPDDGEAAARQQSIRGLLESIDGDAPADDVQLDTGRLFTLYRAQGDEAFEAGKYARAERKYQEALGYRPDSVAVRNRLETVRVQMERQENETRHARLIQQADSLFTNEAYAEAQANYRQALALVPGDSTAAARVDTIDRLVAEREERERAYQYHRGRGDGYFDQGDYRAAIESYRNALDVRPKDRYVLDRISESWSAMEAARRGGDASASTSARRDTTSER